MHFFIFSLLFLTKCLGFRVPESVDYIEYHPRDDYFSNDDSNSDELNVVAAVFVVPDEPTILPPRPNCGWWGNCPGYWSEWSPLSPCSTSCGPGYRQKQRECIGEDYYREYECFGESIYEQSCNFGSCPEWTTWSTWSACDASCGQGNRSRRRDCQYGRSCPGLPYEFSRCTAIDPGYTYWTAWSECSASCGYGSRSRERRRICGGHVDIETDSCINPINYSSWSHWSACPSCYNQNDEPVLSSRQRSEICTHRVDKQQKPCIATYCIAYWSQWTDWGSCSTSCGIGFRERFRQCEGSPDECLNLLGSNSERESCNVGNNGIFNDWSEWTPCSSSCGNAKKYRRRTNSCGEEDVEEEECNNFVTLAFISEIGVWSSWSECIDGFKSRTRHEECSTNSETQSVPCNGSERRRPWTGVRPVTEPNLSVRAQEEASEERVILIMGEKLSEAFSISFDGSTKTAAVISAPSDDYVQFAPHALVNGVVYIFGGWPDVSKIAKLENCEWKEEPTRLINEIYPWSAALSTAGGEEALICFDMKSNKKCELFDGTSTVSTHEVNFQHDGGKLGLYKGQPTTVGSYSWEGQNKVETLSSSGWSFLGDFPSEIAHHFLIGLPSGSLLLAGGLDKDDVPQTAIWLLKNDLWTQIGSLKNANDSGSVLMINNSIFIVSGYESPHSIERLDFHGDELIQATVISQAVKNEIPVLLEAPADYCV